MIYNNTDGIRLNFLSTLQGLETHNSSSHLTILIIELRTFIKLHECLYCADDITKQLRLG